MSLRIGDSAPDFSAESTQGRINFAQWLDKSWCLLFSHPRDFTPVCTTELGYLARLQQAFAERNCKVVGLSVDPVADHRKWLADIKEVTGYDVRYPLIGDPDRSIARLYDLLPAGATNPRQPRGAERPETISTLYIIGPDRIIQAALMYPMSSGRNFDEVLRLLDSCQLTAEYKVATPANWQQGDDVLIISTLSDDEARTRFPSGWKALKPYMRIVPQPHARTATRQ
jgi:alkyl hydroperoxide reductase subunit AhpC